MQEMRYEQPGAFMCEDWFEGPGKLMSEDCILSLPFHAYRALRDGLASQTTPMQNALINVVIIIITVLIERVLADMCGCPCLVRVFLLKYVPLNQYCTYTSELITS